MHQPTIETHRHAASQARVHARCRCCGTNYDLRHFRMLPAVSLKGNVESHRCTADLGMGRTCDATVEATWDPEKVHRDSVVPPAYAEGVS